MARLSRGQHHSRAWISELIAVVLLFAVMMIIVYARTGSKTDQAAAVSSVVTGFGQALQRVSLLAPDAASEMQGAYGTYVDRSLLQGWEADPARAPGRMTSSPWPDHIVINSAAVQPDGSYAVTGLVVEVSSTGIAGTYPVSLTVADENGSWLITSFSGYPASSPG